jgi:Fic family protein
MVASGASNFHPNFALWLASIINRLLDGFEGKLTTEKWAKLAKVSDDTALRDIQDLIRKGILKQEESGGRSTAYTLIRELMV